MNDAQLKPCWRCGEIATVTVYEWECADYPALKAQVRCDCGADGPEKSANNRLGCTDAERGLHRAKAIAAWNRRADLPATPAQIAASPEVRALVEAAASAIVVMQEAKGVIVAKREWALVDGAVKDLRAALAAFKAMEAGG